MANDFTQLGVADYNQSFLDALEFVDQVIQNREHMKVSVWRSMIPRGAYTLGEGLVKKAYRFHGGLGDQRGLQKWRPIQISRTASGDDPGVDACAYNPYTVDYGFETVNYSGFQTERRTPHICVRDIRFTWQFKQQLNLIMSFLGDITNSVWENYAREQYIKFAVDASKGMVLSEGTPLGTTFSYDPFTVDADDDNVITIASGTPVSMLDWSYFRWISRYLQWQAPMAAIGNMDGIPQYGLVFDLEDFDLMVEKNSDLREDWRYANSKMLIANYGTVTSYKGFSLMHDPAAPRFSIKSDNGTTMTLKRVDPLQDDTAATIGNEVNVNEDYLNAEFAIGVIYLNDVFKMEVPPSGPTAPGGGTSFGATPSLNGEFKWLNIPDKDTNLLQENGFYFARYEAFAKPLTYDGEAMCFLYRRVPNVEVADADIGGSDALTSPQTVTTQAAVTGSTVLATCLASGIMEAEAPDVVTVTNDTVAITAVIADSSQAPAYTIAFQSAANATTFIGATTSVVSW